MKDSAIKTHSANLKNFVFPDAFQTEHGGSIHALTLVYETYGELNTQRDNAILIHHALSVGCHVASHHAADNPGWWENMVGPGRPIDTNQFFVICINNLGSCFGSSGPTSINPKTQKPYQRNFPRITIQDMVRSQQLLLTHLGISQLFAVIGNSMGGMLSLSFAIEFPTAVRHLISTSACYKAYPANIANRAIQREIIQFDPHYQQGFYGNTPPLQGLKIARKLGHLTYRNPQAFNAKFPDNSKKRWDEPSDIENYLDYKATQFASYFDPNAYLYLLDAMDLYDASQGDSDEVNPFARIRAKTLIISVDSDILFTPEQQEALFSVLQKAGICVEFIQHHASYGHDTFLVETKEFGEYFRRFLGLS